LVCSNCDHLKFYIGDQLVTEVDPDRVQFPHLVHAPFTADLGRLAQNWGDLRIEGYLNGKLAIVKALSGKGIDQKFLLLPDDTKLNADGADTTRVVLRVTDEFGAVRPFANDAIRFELQGPAEIIGDNPFALIGGTGAIWIRAKEQAGNVRLTATHPLLGTQQVQIELVAAAPETV
jgi:beta-galactosidase